MESPSSVDVSDENILVPCVRNSSYSFPPIVLKLFRRFLHGMKMCMCFRYNPLIIFLTFSALWTLFFFQYEMLSKCLDSGYGVGATPLTVFHQLFWNIGDVFSMEWRCACGLGIILWLFFSLFLLCEFSLFFTWNAIKVYRQWVLCGRNSSYGFPSNVLKLCRCFWHEMKMCMWSWYNTLITFLTFSALWIYSLFLHEMLSQCIDSEYLLGATPLTVLH